MSKIFIIAEAGVNHNGSLELAKKLIDVAVNAGCDCVKFQTFKAENVVSIHASKAEYQKTTTGENENQLEMIKKLELSFNVHQVLIDYCRKKKIFFLSTPFDLESIDFLHSLNMSIFKIPSGEITNLPYLRKINSYGKKVILSTGMSTIKEIENAINQLANCDVTLLHCTTEYPCPFVDVNLRAMLTLKEYFNLSVGYSDHTTGISVPIAAAALGATIIEKHFTLDNTMEGPDHKASLEPDELLQMVSAIRNIEKSLGNGIKQPALSELKNSAIARKSIVAKCAIVKGELFTEANITVKRPGNGVSPMLWDTVIGEQASKDFVEDELLII